MKTLMIVILFSSFCFPIYSQVNQEWASLYNGPVDSSESGSIVKADNSGNVYVTGSSYGIGSRRDIVTIKYNSSGVQQWLQRYNGPDNNFDEPNSMILDNYGNVYLTGYSFGQGTDKDFVTIKYNTSGVQQWVQRFNGTGNGADIAQSIALDESGNVYVTGSSRSILYSEIILIKYNSDGVLQWLQRFNGSGNKNAYASALAIDNSENIIIAGGIDGDSANRLEYVTIKYNSTGILKWSQTYSGLNQGSNLANCITVYHGAIYISGSSDGPGIKDFATLKYDSSGNQQWIQRYDTGNDDEVTGMTVDKYGNAYVTGYSYTTATHADYATVKYNSSGVQEWVQRYNGPSNGYDYAFAIAVDTLESVYVTGSSSETGFVRGCTTIKYNSSGVQEWIRSYSDAGGYAITLLGSGNIYVTGLNHSLIKNQLILTIKYSQQTGINPVNVIIPYKYILSQNYPNPFNPVTKISYDLPKANFVSLKVYDDLGNEVETLVNGRQNAGSYSVTFDAATKPSGIYFYKIVTDGFSETKKMVVVK